MHRRKKGPNQDLPAEAVVGIFTLALVATGFIGYTIAQLAKLGDPRKSHEVDTHFLDSALTLAGVAITAIIAKTANLSQTTRPKDRTMVERAIEARNSSEIAEANPAKAPKKRRSHRDPTLDSSTERAGSSGYDASTEATKHQDVIRKCRLIATTEVNNLIKMAKSELTSGKDPKFATLLKSLEREQETYLASLKSNPEKDPKSLPELRGLQDKIRNLGEYVLNNGFVQGSRTRALFEEQYNSVLQGLDPLHERVYGR